jgi:tRNA U55 pseudouridine synthase TruB
VATLRRTRVGAFTLDRAIELATFVERARTGTVELLAPAAMVGALDTERVAPSDVDALVHGRSIRVATRRGVPASVAVCRLDGSLVAVCDDDGDGELRPTVVLVTQGADSADG